MSNLERTFETLWKQLGGPPLESEYRFHPTRRWRFDFCHIQSKVAIEIEGGTWIGGRHTRGKGFENDCIKYNTATAMGWKVFRITSTMIKENPTDFIEMIKTVIDTGGTQCTTRQPK